ncbi:MAG: response regulator [Verrucomicrobia bacterium]|nr:response regulator [Verrucomicrobiota bacterium]
MNKRAQPLTILMADDDEDDRILTRIVLQKSRVVHRFLTVEDGEELMDYLYRRGKFSDPASSPRPDLVLLDLNMPRKNGWEALCEIKLDPRFRDIPIVVLTVSKDFEDIYRSNNLGADSYLTKPITMQSLESLMNELRPLVAT